MHSESTKLVEGTKNSFNVTLGLGCVRDPEMHSESIHWMDKNSLVYASFLGNWIPLVRSYFKLISWSYLGHSPGWTTGLCLYQPWVVSQFNTSVINKWMGLVVVSLG